MTMAAENRIAPGFSLVTARAASTKALR